VTLQVDKTYRLRARDDAEARWFVFKPRVYVQSQAAWWGKSSTEHDLVVFEREIPHFEIIEVGAPGVKDPVCDCGALKARTTHSLWCSLLLCGALQ
jgi:hypothetical protein